MAVNYYSKMCWTNYFLHNLLRIYKKAWQTYTDFFHVVMANRNVCFDAPVCFLCQVSNDTNTELMVRN